MSRGLGKMERAILSILPKAKEMEESEDIWYYGPDLSPGRYYLRWVAEVLANEQGATHGRGWINKTFTASFARAIKSLIRKGILGAIYHAGGHRIYAIYVLATKEANTYDEQGKTPEYMLGEISPNTYQEGVKAAPSSTRGLRITDEIPEEDRYCIPASCRAKAPIRCDPTCLNLIRNLPEWGLRCGTHNMAPSLQIIETCLLELREPEEVAP